MSDPLSIAAGVVGLLTAAAQISSVLIKATRSVKGAPSQAEVIIMEVNDTSSILSHLQAFLLGEQFADTSRASLLRVEHLVNVISSCVLTFSELEKLLDKLKTGEMEVLDRVKWTRKEPTILDLIQRLENHKVSLSLILNILNGESIADAKNSLNRLFNLVETHYQEMSVRLRSLESHESEQENAIPDENDAASIATIKARDSILANPIPDGLHDQKEGFIQDLEKSWVYRRAQTDRHSTYSFETKSVHTNSWSYLSALSVAEVSQISVINLPITQDEVFNEKRVQHTWSPPQFDGETPVERPLPVALTSHGFNFDVGEVGHSIQDSIDIFDSSSCQNCENLLPVDHIIRLGQKWWHMRCFDCFKCGSRLDPANLKDVNLQSDGSLTCPTCTCKGCGFVLLDNYVHALGHRWHYRCFRCATCGKFFDSNSFASIMRNNRGSLNCQKCSSNKESSSRSDLNEEPYMCRYFSWPLPEQTRRTRIAWRLEDAEDPTEFWIPALPWRCIDYLNHFACEDDRVYRASGSVLEIRHWQKRFDQEGDINFFGEVDFHDINLVRSLFKSWLCALPSDIFPKAIQIKIEKAHPDATEVPQLMKDELSMLPPWNYYLLFAVTCHLSVMLAYADKNQLTYIRLKVCFRECLRMEDYCFLFLVQKWRDCWQGCWTEQEALVEELKFSTDHWRSSLQQEVEN